MDTREVSMVYNRLAMALEEAAYGIGADFAALAKVATPGKIARWIGSYGASNTRLARMELRSGLGVGGMAMRLGVPYQASADKNAHMLVECPVMLAERLGTALAVPFTSSTSDLGCGVLLVGRRKPLSFGGDEIDQICMKKPLWIELSELWRYDGGNGALYRVEERDDSNCHCG